MGCSGAMATVFPGVFAQAAQLFFREDLLDNLSFTKFQRFLQGMERNKNHLGAYESGLSESGGVPDTLWFAETVSSGNVLSGPHFFHPNCHPINERAERGNTCPAYRQTDFAKKGLNKMTFFLALKTEEASSTVTNPELCRQGERVFFRGGRL